MTYFLAALLLAQANCRPQPFSVEDAKAVVMQTPRILKYQKKHKDKPLFVNETRPKMTTSTLDRYWIFQASSEPNEKEISKGPGWIDTLLVEKNTLEVVPLALDHPPPIRTKEVLQVQRQLSAEHCITL